MQWPWMRSPKLAQRSMAIACSGGCGLQTHCPDWELGIRRTGKFPQNLQHACSPLKFHNSARKVHLTRNDVGAGMTIAESADLVGSGRSRASLADAFPALMTIVAAVSRLSCSLRWALMTGLRRWIVALIAGGLAFAPLPLGSFHDALALSTAEIARHSALAMQDTAEHGHTHEEGESQEQAPGHLHGHDPVDHSHQFAFFVSGDGDWGLPAPQRWALFVGDPPDPAFAFSIDRPPKLATSV